MDLGWGRALGCRLEQAVWLRLVGHVEMAVLAQKGGGGGHLRQAGGGAEGQL